MWLLHTKNIRLQDFMPGSEPEYAILSHTWTDEEISFRDAQTGDQSKVKGWQKIKSSCARALADGFTWIWIDTCCIDKSSSAELSEAINSMWRYYRESKVCYAYLADVPRPKNMIENDTLYGDNDFDNGKEAFALRSLLSKSRWFTRGWTLQELLAPSNLLFCSQDWLVFGRKEDITKTLHSITNIHETYFTDNSFASASIAQKMSWASKRQTTRPEDIAYSLLGLFDINMPLLYGEGTKAFKRLQLELIRNSTDQSIFAWKCDDSVASQGSDRTLGVLAESPSWFAESASIADTSRVHAVSPCNVTNAGIQMRLQIGPLQPLQSPSKFKYTDGNFWIVMLACNSHTGSDSWPRVGICVDMDGTTVERDPIPKKGKEVGYFIRSAHRAFPDYIHLDYQTFGWPFKSVYLGC